MSDLNTPSNFDLEHAIAAWRARLTDPQNGAVPDAAELEAHLRDGIATLRAVGLSAEEAFYVSAKRLGDPAALSLEFAKVDPLGQWRIQLTWMAAGYLGTNLVGAVTNATAIVAIRLMLLAGLRGAMLNYLDPPLFCCLCMLGIVVVLLRSAMPSGGEEKLNRPAAWMHLLRNYLTANPARCICVMIALLLLSNLVYISQYFQAGIRPDAALILEMAVMNLVMMVMLPTFVMVLALRGRQSLGAD